MDEPLSGPAHTENSAIAGSRPEQIPQIAMQQASAVGQLTASRRELDFLEPLLDYRAAESLGRIAGQHRNAFDVERARPSTAR